MPKGEASKFTLSILLCDVKKTCIDTLNSLFWFSLSL